MTTDGNAGKETVYPDYRGHRRRIKEKYLSAGVSGWADYEVLEFALSYALHRKDTKPLAKDLIARFKSLAGVLDADIREVQSIKGISLHTALFLNLLKDVSILYTKSGICNKDLISSPESAVRYLTALLKGSPDEEFHALFLNASNHLITSENMQTGIVNRSAVYPRKIAERALYHHAVGLIIVHNHPGGSLKPSDDDLRATLSIKNALNTVEVSLLDHIIVCSGGYFSWKEHNLI